jgi:hypothetical protein
LTTTDSVVMSVPATREAVRGINPEKNSSISNKWGNIKYNNVRGRISPTTTIITENHNYGITIYNKNITVKSKINLPEKLYHIYKDSLPRTNYDQGTKVRKN